jgi:hypothetical protein
MNMTLICSIHKLLHSTSNNTLLQKTVKKQGKLHFKSDPTLLEFVAVRKKGEVPRRAQFFLDLMKLLLITLALTFVTNNGILNLPWQSLVAVQVCMVK